MHCEASPSLAGPIPVPYTAEEIGRTFAGLLATFEFRQELFELGIGPLRVIKRARVRKLLTALSVALWHVALEKSFPKDADEFFNHFVATYPPLKGEGRSARKFRELVSRYDSLVLEKKDTDFSEVARHIAEDIGFQPADSAKGQLWLSLRIRAAYDLIFEKLI